MSTVSITAIQAGTDILAAPVQGNFEAVRDVVNGDLDADNLTGATREKLGLSDSSTVRRGAVIISAQETTTSTSFVLLTTADQVANVSVPANGLLRIVYQARWHGDGNSQAAIFLNAVQVQAQDPTTGAMAGQTVAHPGGGTPFTNVLYATRYGLATTAFSADAGAPVTTGQGLYSDGCLARVAAGTYTVSVRFRNTGGVLTTMASRELYVTAEGY